MDRSITVIKNAECDKIRNEVSRFITRNMNGLDIGSDGAPLFIESVSIDRTCGNKSHLVQLRGDARDLYWFKDAVMDYVFSSHCLEDFIPEEKHLVMKEWIRVIKQNGYFILYLPDEQKYKKKCEETGQSYNKAHKDKLFGISTVRNIVSKYFKNQLMEIYAKENCGPYSFLLIYRKIK
ncbi:MAG: methyltransferase domain-containing protein [Candidatus Hodarchaeota archaeon]